MTKRWINKGMRQSIMIICIILLCTVLFGCTRPVSLEELFKSEEYLSEYDMPPEYMSMNGRVDRVGQTYYLSTEHWIKFYEMDTHISGFLCNKPECTHDTDTCNANIGYCLRGIHIYNGYIYWIRQNRGSALWRMKPDGSEHEKVFDIEIDTSSISDYSFAMHRGYFYYYAINNRIKDGQDVSAFTMIRYPLDGSEHQKEIIYEEDYGYAFRCSVSFVRNKAYALIIHQKRYFLIIRFWLLTCKIFRKK
ncbi:MAG: hypothetical protein IJM90_03620 [Firmicutes bacterium]|nr:hypothetical protein [Bacillota bacterium]